MALLALVVAFGLVALAGAGKSVREGLSHAIRSVVRPEPKPATVRAISSTSADVEQRARAHHGWGPTVVDAVEKGSIARYDRSGAITSQGTLVIYRKFPDLVRVEVTPGGSTDVSGFDGTGAWDQGQGALADAAARDIRQWLRAGPEHLFISRDGGAAYREPGRRAEDHLPPTPWQGPVDLAQPREYDQVELIDLVGPSAPAAGVADRRRLTYLVDRQTSLVSAVRWLEPANASQGATDPTASLVETRIDFGLWRDVKGVQWPFDIVHWSGGRVDYRATLASVQMNQNLSGSLFQHP